MNGISKPLVEELTQLWFNDDNTALANTVEAMENSPFNSLGKKNINKIIEEVVAKGTVIVYNEMQRMKTRLTSQAKKFATYVADKAAKALKKINGHPKISPQQNHGNPRIYGHARQRRLIQR